MVGVYRIGGAPGAAANLRGRIVIGLCEDRLDKKKGRSCDEYHYCCCFHFSTHTLNQFRSIRRHRDIFDNLRRRIEILSEGKAPYPMTSAVEDVGEAATRTGNIIKPCAVLEDVYRNADSIDLGDTQRRVPFRTIGRSAASIDVVDQRTRICDGRNRNVGRDRSGADQEGANRRNQSNVSRAHDSFSP